MAKTLKEQVLERCEEIAPEAGETYNRKNGSILRTNDRQIGDRCNQWKIDEYRASSWVGIAIDDTAPENSHVWPLAAKILGIEDEQAKADRELVESAFRSGYIRIGTEGQGITLEYSVKIFDAIKRLCGNDA